MRSIMGLCILVGGTVGSLLPELWGASSLSLASFVFGGFGSVAGVWIGSRLASF
ncbi:MAG TPA: hypothetical protein VGM80_00510 [Gaiellaceae bacterium]|jgi:hypothetical protein